MPVGRRTTLAAASGTIGAACAAAPWLTWLTATGRAGHCGWTCYRAADAPLNVVSLSGRGGAQVAPALGVLLVALAVLIAAVVVLALVGGRPPVLLGRAVTVVGFAALVWTVVVIVRYAEGGTLVRTQGDGVFAANLGAGAIVSLAAAAAAVLLGGGIALRARWAGYPAPDAHHEPAPGYPGRSRS
ncbi:hypothetical protein [Patulibacter sp.]|uniref:hypothetical protein n=1 Tax=Patulibacter sp. TaxID=1912859 RepID=UPI00271EEDC1|nr:hypothetical protein [Patulibacter sp.]MDO9409080.1 hypothetical protein [Patulibacter sp.]